MLIKQREREGERNREREEEVRKREEEIKVAQTRGQLESKDRVLGRMIWAWIRGSSLHSDIVREKPPPTQIHTFNDQVCYLQKPYSHKAFSGVT